MFFNDCNKPDEGGLAVKMLPRSESHQVSPSKENPVNRDIIDSASHSTSMSTESPTMNIPTTASYSPASTRPLHNTSTSMPPHNGIAPNFNADAMQESNEKVFSIKSKQTTEEDILTDAVSKRLEHVHGLELSQTESQELPKTTSPVSDQLLDLKHSSDVFQYKGTSEIPYIEQSDHNVTLMTPNSTTTSTKNLTIMEDLSIWGTQAGLLGRYENRTEDGGNTQPFSIYSIQPSSWSTLEGMPLNIMLIPTKGTQKPTEVSFQVNNLEQSTSTSSSLTTENMLKETTALFKKFVWNTESMARTTSDPLPIPVRKTESGIPVKQFSPAHRYIQLTANPLRSWSVVHKLIAEYSNESRKSGLRKQQLTKVMFQAMYMVDKKQCNIYNIEMIMETILTLLYAGFSIYGLVNSYAFLKSVTHR